MFENVSTKDLHIRLKALSRENHLDIPIEYAIRALIVDALQKEIAYREYIEKTQTLSGPFVEWLNHLKYWMAHRAPHDAEYIKMILYNDNRFYIEMYANDSDGNSIWCNTPEEVVEFMKEIKIF